MKKFDISQNWPQIRTHFNKSLTTSLHVSIASVNAQKPFVREISFSSAELIQAGEMTSKYF